MQLAIARSLQQLNRPGFPGEYFSWELRLPDPYSRWKHNMPVRLLPWDMSQPFQQLAIVVGVSLEIGNFCTLSVLFNQS